MEKIYYLGFSLFNGIGSVGFEKLFQTFGSAKNAWHAEKEDLEKIVGASKAEKFVAFRKTTHLEKELEKCVQKDVQLIPLADKSYPALLKEISHPPFLLYVKGNAAVLSFPKTIGIVGTRKITPYGKQVTDMLTVDLVAAGFATVSGLAFGVDATTHMATIRAGGKTVAVLGCGVDCCYPRENEKVYEEILASGGAIVSTFPVGMGATLGSFPARNGTIAGLSQAIVVTEGAADSGALITATYAKKIGRPVFAVPGPITSTLSKGTNSLLKNGAIAVTTSQDILDTLGIIAFGKSQSASWRTTHKKQKGDTKEEQELLEFLQNTPLHFDEIVRRMKKDSKNIGSLLSLMELKGLVKSNADGKYSI